MSEIVYRPHKMKCADGVTRTVRVRSYHDGRRWCMHGDTYFSVPAFTKANGKTVRGFVSSAEGVLVFSAYRYHKNAGAIRTQVKGA